MTINSFILSQIGIEQNEFFFQTTSINKSLLVKQLYSFIEEFDVSTSFFRVFKFEDSAVAAYCWKSDEFEPGTSRKGLYVILGFIIDDISSDNIDKLLQYSLDFFMNVEWIFSVSLLQKTADDLFKRIQINSPTDLSQLNELVSSLHIREDICDDIVKKTRLTTLRGKINIIKKMWFLKVREKVKKRQVLSFYILSEGISFFEVWCIFLYEACCLFEKGNLDIATIDSTNGTILHLKKIENLPEDADNIKLKVLNNIRYLFFSQKL